MKRLSPFLLLLAFAPAGLSAALTSASARVTDSAGAARDSFSSTERITLNMQAQNTSASGGTIQFSFEIQAPNGARRLSQSGNAAPGSILGTAGASLRGVAVSQFYTLPGVYTLVGRATLDGQTVESRAQFTVLSPVLTLTYPPNGARDIIDQPLVFRWVSSGATRYRVFVDDDSSFYQTLFTGESVANFFSYPQNPPDVRQRLASGQVYYWKVEGLDISGNVVARSDVPFSFSVKPQSTQANSKDLAVVSIEVNNEAVPGSAGALPIAVTVKNQGGRAETGAPVNLFADGAAVPMSPKKTGSIEPGRTEKLVFPVRPPEAGKFTLLNATLDFFDDNLQNNTLAKQIRAEDLRPGHRRRQRPNEAWDFLRRYLTDARVLVELEGYAAVEITGEGMSEQEISDLIQALKDGEARILSVRLKTE